MAKVTEVRDGGDDAAEAEVVDTALADEVGVADAEETLAGGTGGDGETGAADDGGIQDQPETLVVTIGDEKPPEEDDNLNFKQLRDSHREKVRENRELKRKLDAVQGTQSDPALGPKPALADFSYDTEKYETAAEAWLLKKADADAAKRKRDEAQTRADAAWQEKLNGYGNAKTAFRVRAPDFDEAEATVQDALSVTQQGIIVHGAKDAPILLYALHKNPAKLKELAAITDPVEFTWKIAQLEAQLKVSTTKRQPEERVSGTVATGRGGDQHLSKLRAEAERTGDLSKVLAYKRQQKQKQIA